MSETVLRIKTLFLYSVRAGFVRKSFHTRWNSLQKRLIHDCTILTSDSKARKFIVVAKILVLSATIVSDTFS